MTDHDRLTEIFLRACAVGPEERAAFLGRACGDDRVLRAEIEAMLEHDERAGGTQAMAVRVQGVAAALAGSAAASAPIPERLGRYRILARIGEGSMGVVYRARQRNPDRDVALKLIAQPIPSADLLRRFEVEGQVLGRLQHPGIAQIIEAGVVESELGSQPFFAMEYVEGLPLGEHVARHGLALRERVDLVIRVCEAVQHAHQRGVIHRDLKPANILVDAAGQPKILDFGVARVTDREIAATTAHTRHGALIGTLGYMSPEQVRGGASDVDTRADVYSLGAVCYEVLTGRLPHDLDGASLPEAIRRVAEERPRRLSAAGARFPSDLETIVAKALEPDGERRYGSASELAADLRRFLADEPIAARSPSAFYQLRKLVARNRLAAGLVGALALSVAAFATAMAVQAARIRAERDRAEREAGVASQVSRFLGEVFNIPNPGSARGQTVTAREVLERGVERIRTELVGAPRLRSRLMTTMAEAHVGLGLRDEAEKLFREALEVEASSPERDPEGRVRALAELAWLECGRGKYDEGLTLSREAEDVALAAFGAEHREFARGLLVSGALLRDKGAYEEAGERLDRARAIYERAVGGESEEVGKALYHTGWLLHLRKEDEAARRTYERACSVLEGAVGRDHPRFAWCMNDLSVVLSSLGRPEEASVAMTRAVGVWERILPPDHPDLAAGVDNLGTLHWKAGDFEAAAEQYLRGLEMRRRSLGPGHLDVARSLHNLALATRDLGRAEEAISHFREAIEIFRATLGPDHARVHNPLLALAGVHRQRGDFQEALEIHRELGASLERTRGPDDPDLAVRLTSQGECLLLLGRPQEADPLLVRALAIQERAFGAEDPRLARVLVALADCREAQGLRDDESTFYARAEAILVPGQETKDASRAAALQQCSRHARREGDLGRANALLARAIEAWESGATRETAGLLYARAVAAAQGGEPDKALALLRQALERRLPVEVVDREVELAPLRDDPALQALLRQFGVAVRAAGTTTARRSSGSR